MWIEVLCLIQLASQNNTRCSVSVVSSRRPGPGPSPPAPTTATSVQEPFEILRYRLEVHEIAETSPGTFPHLILPATSLSEVRHWRQFRVYRLAFVPSIVQIHHCLLCMIFSIELNIDIAYQVVSKVITDVHFFNFSVFVFQLDKYVLEKFVEVRLFLLVCEYLPTVGVSSRVVRILVHVLEQNGLTERGLVVKSRAPISMTTSSNLEVERAVHLVLFRTKYRSEVFRHLSLRT